MDLGAMIEGPPCESQIERDVEYRFLKYLAPDTRVERQAWVNTAWGAFRIDFLLLHHEQRIGIECDGASFHDEYRDEWRDAIVLGSGELDEIIRLAGQDIHYRPDDCIYLLSQMHPEVFTERSRCNLERIASPEARDAQFLNGKLRYVALVPKHGDDGEIGAQSTVRIAWRRRNAMRQYWQKLYEAALAIGPCSLDELIARDFAIWSNRF